MRLCLESGQDMQLFGCSKLGKSTFIRELRHRVFPKGLGCVPVDENLFRFQKARRPGLPGRPKKEVEG